jgi:aquaporin NIP
VLVGCGAIMVDAENDGALGTAGIAAAFGLVIGLLVFALGPVSGAHFNPAVTFGLAVVGRTPWRVAPAYWLAQTLGAVAAAIVLRISLGDVADLGTTQPSESQVQAFVWELLLTALLLLTISSVLGATPGVAAVAVGSAIAIGALVGGPISGGSMNPARSLGPALVSGNLHALWLYLVAPVVGAAFGVLGYRAIARS